MSPFQTHGIDHLSASNINLFVAQPSLWAVTYLLKRRTAVGPAAHRGTAVEAGIEAGLFNPDMPVAEAQAIGAAKFHTLTRLSGDPRVEKEREAVAPMIEIGLVELRQYGVPDKCDTARQHKIEVELGDGLPPAIGYLDLVWAGHGILADIKSTMRVPSEMSAAHCRQGVIYQKAHGNYETRFVYISPKKLTTYRLEDGAAHFDEVVRIARCMERFLSLSDDREKLVRALYPDAGSFYWGDQSAVTLMREIWG